MMNRARKRAAEIPKLPNSILKGAGRLAACVGEEVALKIFGGEIVGELDYDIVSAQDKKIEVKTKQRSVEPKPSYECSVADFNTKQKCDRYAFISVLTDFSAAWYLGSMSRKKFYNKAKFCKKGEVDDSNGFVFRADCYNIKISELDK